MNIYCVEKFERYGFLFTEQTKYFSTFDAALYYVECLAKKELDTLFDPEAFVITKDFEDKKLLQNLKNLVEFSDDEMFSIYDTYREETVYNLRMSKHKVDDD